MALQVGTPMGNSGCHVRTSLLVIVISLLLESVVHDWILSVIDDT